MRADDTEQTIKQQWPKSCHDALFNIKQTFHQRHIVTILLHLTVHFNVSNFKYHDNLNRLILCVLFVRKLNIVLVVMKTSILMLTFQAI